MTGISRISEVAAAGKKPRAAALRVMDYLRTGNEVTREAERGNRRKGKMPFPLEAADCTERHKTELRLD